MPFIAWLNTAESIYDIPGLKWTRGKIPAQFALGLLCGACLLAMIFFLFSKELDPHEFILFFLRPNVPIIVSMILALASVLVLSGLFCLALSFFAFGFYSWTGAALHMIIPWAAHRFRALSLAVFYTWSFTAVLNTALFVLNRTDLGSRLFVVFYTGKGFEFLYQFLAVPGFYHAVLGIAYPAAEVLAYLTQSHHRASKIVRLRNQLKT